MARNVFAEARKLIKPEDGTIAYVITIDGVNRLFVFYALKDIKKGEEIFTDYEAQIKYTKEQGLI